MLRCDAVESSECSATIVIRRVNEYNALIAQMAEKLHPDISLMRIWRHRAQERLVQVLLKRKHMNCLLLLLNNQQLIAIKHLADIKQS